MKFIFFVMTLVMSSTFLASQNVQAYDTLTEVLERDRLNCGVNDQLHGFAHLDKQGIWQGFEVDLCRALAVAILEDHSKVTFMPLNAKTRFSALKDKRVDILLRSVTWTYTRDAVYGFDFPAVVYYDRLAIIAPKKLGITTLSEMREGSICVADGTTTLSYLLTYIQEHNLNMSIRVFYTREGLNDFFFAGQCDFYADDHSALVSILKMSSPAPENYVFLDTGPSKDPLSPAIRQGDERWNHLIKWLIFALLEAEERNITQSNLTQHLDSNDPVVRFMLGVEKGIGAPFNLPDAWIRNVLQRIGNYGEIFERNLGQGSDLNMERGLNKLWRDGGLMYAMPFR